MIDGFYRAELSYYVAGFDVRNGHVGFCAPIMAWAKGKSAEYFAQWVRRKRGKIERIGDIP